MWFHAELWTINYILSNNETVELKFQKITAKQKEQTTFPTLFLNLSVSQGSTGWEQLKHTGNPRLHGQVWFLSWNCLITASRTLSCMNSCLVDRELSSLYVSRTTPDKLKLKNIPNPYRSPQDIRGKGITNLPNSLVHIHDLSISGHIYCPCPPFPAHLSPPLYFLTPLLFCVSK